MKINEIKPQLYEGIGSTLIQKGANWLGQKLGNAVTSSTNIESQTAKIFAKNFVDKTNAGLASAGTMINSPLAKQKFISKMVSAFMKNVDMSAYQQEVDNATPIATPNVYFTHKNLCCNFHYQQSFVLFCLD